MRTILPIAAVVLAGCAPNVSGGPDAGAPSDGGGRDGAAIDLAAPIPDGAVRDLAAACGAGASCDGGLCVAGACCDLPRVCGATCCAQGSVCLAGGCVTPGKPCHSANDCPMGDYCEPAIGGGGGADGGIVGDAAFCTQPLPEQGRCLPLPPRCADGGVEDGGCLPPCEYHPPVGPLAPVAKWTWGPTAKQYPNFTDVWSTPTVGRLWDGNCDGVVDELDAPNVVFVAGAVAPSNAPRDNGVLRMLDGRTGQEVWSLRRASPQSTGFMGFSIAIGDVDLDGRMDIVAVTGEKYVVLVDALGNVKRTSDKPIPEATTGWGGGLALADMDNDGHTEIAFGATVFSTLNGQITRLWSGAGGNGGGGDQQLSTFADLDGLPDGHLELLAGNTAYKADGSILWRRMDLPNGFPGVGDLDRDGHPDAVLVGNGNLWILDGATGKTELGPFRIAGGPGGGPPTVADFDGDGKPEIGVANDNFYTVAKPDYANKTIDFLWKVPNHDLSSSVTGSSVFDFEGDGRAEVIYGDECFLWVFDGPTGNVRFAAPHTSFTATEASVVADVDGDGHAEILMVSNGASPVDWQCENGKGQPATVNGVTWKPSGAMGNAYRGIVAFGDPTNGWVGTRTLWNQHTYHVTNICDDRDSACVQPNRYGSIPKGEIRNWNVPWLDDFRQNVQDRGLFDAPDATVTLTVDCTTPPVLHPTVRNLGLAALPAGVDVQLFITPGDKKVGEAMTTHALLPGQAEPLTVTLNPGDGTTSDTYYAKIVVDPNNLKFHECRADNDTSAPFTPNCLQ